MKSRTMNAALILLCLLLCACALDTASNDAERTAMAHAENSLYSTSVTYTSTHLWDRGVIVLYRGFEQRMGSETETERLTGMVLLERRGETLKVVNSTVLANSIINQNALPVDFVTLGGEGTSQPKPSIVWGEVRSNDVASVKVRFDNAAEFEEKVQDRLFVVTVDNSLTACSITLLSANNEVIDRIILYKSHQNEGCPDN